MAKPEVPYPQRERQEHCRRRDRPIVDNPEQIRRRELLLLLMFGRRDRRTVGEHGGGGGEESLHEDLRNPDDAAEFKGERTELNIIFHILNYILSINIKYVCECDIQKPH